MTNPVRYRTLDANEAVADVAYRLSEVIAIYPITPASIFVGLVLVSATPVG